MKNISYICVLFLVILLGSCERYDYLDLNIPFKQKIVAVTLLEAGNVDIQVSLTHTFPVYENQNFDIRLVKDAEVYLQHPRETIQLVYSEDEQMYKGTLTTGPLEEGETWTVFVKGAEESIEGTTTIPVSASPVFTTKLDRVIQYDLPAYRLSISSRFPEGGTHNLKLDVKMIYSDSGVYQTQTQISRLEGGNASEDVLISMLSSEPDYPVRVEITPFLCDDHYLNYSKLLEKGNQGIPFSEPVISSGSMSNNLGLAGSYVKLPTQIIPLN